MNKDNFLSNDRYKKIMYTLDLVCPMYSKDLITEALIVGSVANNCSKENSDIDIYLINPLFENQTITHGIEIKPIYDNKKDIYIRNISNYLKNIDIEFKIYHKKDRSNWYQLYKGEVFHLMFDYNVKSIKNAGEYIEITKKFCEILKVIK